MKRKSWITGVFCAAFVTAMLYLGIATGNAEMPFETNKTDRTLIKEIWQGQKEIQQNQKEIIRLLKDMKTK